MLLSLIVINAHKLIAACVRVITSSTWVPVCHNVLNIIIPQMVNALNALLLVWNALVLVLVRHAPQDMYSI